MARQKFIVLLPVLFFFCLVSSSQDQDAPPKAGGYSKEVGSGKRFSRKVPLLPNLFGADDITGLENGDPPAFLTTSPAAPQYWDDPTPDKQIGQMTWPAFDPEVKVKEKKNFFDDESRSEDVADGLNDRLGELLDVHGGPIIINDRASINYRDYDDYYYNYDDDYLPEDGNDEASIIRVPRSRSLETPAAGRRILSSAPEHLRMSEKEMEHMMMMMLRNAVTQVEMEEDSNNNSERRPTTTQSRPTQAKQTKPSSRRPKVIGGDLLPPVTSERPTPTTTQRSKAKNRGRPREEKRQQQLAQQRKKEEEKKLLEQRQREEAIRREEERLRQQQQKLEEQQRRVQEEEQRRLKQAEEARKLQQLQEQQRRQLEIQEQQRRQEQQQREEQKRRQEEEQRLRQQELLKKQQMEDQRRREQEEQARRSQAQPNEPKRRPQSNEAVSRPQRPRRPKQQKSTPIVVAQVKPPQVISETKVMKKPNQNPSNPGFGKSASLTLSRRGKAFRENNSRNRIFPPPPNIPETNFDCADYQFPGLYADIEASCEVFHMCQSSGHVNSFKCPLGTRFDQRHMVCNWAEKVECEKAPEFFSNNKDLYS